MEWILFYYNSLPDMPEGCSLFSNDIFHRDFFKCNPSNTGHYRYPKFESLVYDDGCHEREVHNFMKRMNKDKYVIFYTRHTDLFNNRRNIIVGYFKVGRLISKPLGFYASETVLLPKSKSIGINYLSRGVPVSWGNSKVRNMVTSALDTLKRMVNSNFNITSKYKAETKSIMTKLKSAKGKRKLLMICDSCFANRECYWGRKSHNKRARLLDKLYPTIFDGRNLC